MLQIVYNWANRRAPALGATARKKEDKKETCSVFAVATIRQSICLIPYIPLAVGVKTKQKPPSARGWIYALSWVVIRYAPNAPDYALYGSG